MTQIYNHGQMNTVSQRKHDQIMQSIKKRLLKQLYNNIQFMTGQIKTKQGLSS